MTRQPDLFLFVVLVSAACGTDDLATRAQRIDQGPCTTVSVENEETDDDALTARIVVTAEHPAMITGDVDASAGGVTCGIAVYIAPGARATIRDADVHAAEAFGIYNQGGQITVIHSRVRDISGDGDSCGGEEEDADDACGGGSGGMGGGDDRAYTGGRHGTGILFVDGASGTITDSSIAGYGRRGISISGPGTSARIVGDQLVAPDTPASWSNGIWIANGASSTIESNTISGNLSPAGIGKASSAIMIAGGPSHNGMPSFTTGNAISANDLVDSDTGVLLSNPGIDGTSKLPPPVITRNRVTGNTIVTHRPIGGSDAGLDDAGGNGDVLAGNTISGYGARSIVISPYTVDTVVRGNQLDQQRAAP